MPSKLRSLSITCLPLWTVFFAPAKDGFFSAASWATASSICWKMLVLLSHVVHELVSSVSGLIECPTPHGVFCLIWLTSDETKTRHPKNSDLMTRDTSWEAGFLLTEVLAVSYSRIPSPNSKSKLSQYSAVAKAEHTSRAQAKTLSRFTPSSR